MCVAELWSQRGIFFKKLLVNDLNVWVSHQTHRQFPNIAWVHLKVLSMLCANPKEGLFRN